MKVKDFQLANSEPLQKSRLSSGGQPAGQPNLRQLFWAHGEALKSEINWSIKYPKQSSEEMVLGQKSKWDS